MNWFKCELCNDACSHLMIIWIMQDPIPYRSIYSKIIDGERLNNLRFADDMVLTTDERIQRYDGTSAEYHKEIPKQRQRQT
ncbi:hypothetical protein JTB14_030252 [Gonioctena quinquepunctata]|nr:hypothetical protein JTB14_030252 [Gonioctena quinquepunctata]